MTPGVTPIRSDLTADPSGQHEDHLFVQVVSGARNVRQRFHIHGVKVQLPLKKRT